MLRRALFPVLMACATAVAICPACNGQGSTSSTLRFTEDTWDFGTIKEIDGPVSHTFEFTNTGKNAIVIERVSVSCGCTSPSYSKEAVMPGKKGTVKITYDPSMRPGPFNKEIYVVSNNGKNNNKLIIEGTVEGRPRTMEEDYPYVFGDGFRLNTLSANFHYVAQGRTTQTTVGYANSSERPVKVSLNVVPNDGVISVDPIATVCAGCWGELALTANVPTGDMYGKQVYRVIPVVDGIQQSPGITVTIIATDDFSRINKAEAPSAVFSAAFYNFGTVKPGAKPTHTFTLTNEGKTDLVIRSIEPQAGISVDVIKGVKIEPGKTAEIKCTLNTSGAKKGTFTRVVSIITNDPGRPMRELRLAASVEGD